MGLLALPLSTNFAVVSLERIADADNPAGILTKVTPGIAVLLLPSNDPPLGLFKVMMGSVAILPSLATASSKVVVL